MGQRFQARLQNSVAYGSRIVPVHQTAGTDVDHSYCQICRARPYCLPALCQKGRVYCELNSLVQRRRILHEGDILFRQHEPADFLMVLSSGVCKSYFLDSKCREHVCGFFYPGDLIGTESLYHDLYQTNAVILETGCVCYISVAEIHQALSRSADLQQQVIKMLSQQLWHEYAGAGSFSAEERVVQFLLDLSRKQKRLGYSEHQLRLFMSRSDIANYLGMRSETISRVLTRLQRDDVIRVHRESINLRDLKRLETLAAVR